MGTLYGMCLTRTAELLKSGYWDTHFSFGSNPFCELPSAIVDALLAFVIKLSVFHREPFYLQSSDLHLLLTSGQVREFVLEDVNVPAEHLQKILVDLASACQRVTKIKMRNVFSDKKEKAIVHVQKKQALNLLLSEAHNIKYVESCMEFDLNVLSRSVHLEKLILNFLARSHLYDFLKVNGQLMPNSSLKCLEVFHNKKHPVKYEDIARMMQHCIELREINCDISKSLQFLHGKELYNGTLTPKYNIEKCHLGCANAVESSVSRDGVFLALLTCPKLTDINIVVIYDEPIIVLRGFKNLTTLSIHWDHYLYGVYTSGVQLLLEKPEVGQKLSCLKIFRFTDIDFASIGECCPNLKELRVEYEHERIKNQISRTSFKKLKHLYLESEEDYNIETIISLLTNATDLESLVLLHPGELNDIVLQDILKKNSFSKLMHFSIFRCYLSIEGTKYLVSRCKNLKLFQICEPLMNASEIRSVISEINPLVEVDVRSTDFYGF